jgi:hypothetical protein
MTNLELLMEYMEQNQYFIGNDLLAKYNELLQKEKKEQLTLPDVVKPFYCGSDYNHNAGRCKSQCRLCMLEEKKG